MKQPKYVPMSRNELDQLGWEEIDILLINGDAYVDHPSFGTAIIARLLIKDGFRVGIVSQPDWRKDTDFLRLGYPKYFIGITAGNLDSMINHYTAAKRRRRFDAYSPGGQTGLRPDRATIVYANRVREIFKNIPIVIGGIEASLRRFSHYDYWNDNIRRSILVDARADLLVYGMGELQIREIARRLRNGEMVSDLKDIRGTCYLEKAVSYDMDKIFLPSHEEVVNSKQKYAEAFRIQYEQSDPIRGKILLQKQDGRYIVQNPPARLLTSEEMDEIYELPYARDYHPHYEKYGGVPAIKEVQFSIVTHRGCFGACSFCALVAHQGRIIQSRSKDSILKEVKLLTRHPDFRGIIHDVGGPSANFWGINCEHQLIRGACKGKQCLYPEPCRNLPKDHTPLLELLKEIQNIPKIRKVFVRSGIRYDFALCDSSGRFLEELCLYYISGQLKVAPEHVAPSVTKLMQKPPREVYDRFVQKYQEINERIGKKQYLVPYFISSHPGSSLQEAIELAEYIRDMGYNPEQVQDYIPTPMTLSACMYFTEINPLTGEKVYVPKTLHEKSMQRALLQYRDPKNRQIVLSALREGKRSDLIGKGANCLVRDHSNKMRVSSKAKKIKHRNKWK